MTIAIESIPAPSDQDLLSHIERAATTERRATAHLIALLMELDARRLFLAQGCSSLFTYCTQALHLSEHAAYGRIEAARAARRFPPLLEHLVEGSLNLTGVRLLASHLTSENHREVLDAARYRSKREIEHIVASDSATRCPYQHPEVAGAAGRLRTRRAATDRRVTRNRSSAHSPYRERQHEVVR